MELAGAHQEALLALDSRVSRPVSEDLTISKEDSGTGSHQKSGESNLTNLGILYNMLYSPVLHVIESKNSHSARVNDKLNGDQYILQVFYALTLSRK